MSDVKIIELDQGAYLTAEDALVYVQDGVTKQVRAEDVAWGVKTLANLADQDYVNTVVDELIGGAPAVLDTLKELADAIGDDPNFATSISTAIGQKLNSADFGTRFDQAFGSKSTSGLAEGSNLYFTTARARASISAGTGISYNPTTGVISSTGSTSNDPTFNSVTTGTLNVQNVAFTGTGAVNIHSGNDLNLTAAGDIFLNGERTISLTELKAVVAASTDFANFKTRIAAL